MANRRTDVERRRTGCRSLVFRGVTAIWQEQLCVMAGFIGTAIGLSMQAKSLAGGATSFTGPCYLALHHGKRWECGRANRDHDLGS